jgi:membrane-bound serine protease (ClpP class)
MISLPKFRHYILHLLFLMIAIATPGPAILKAAQLPTHPVRRVLQLTVDSTINPATFDYLSAGYKRAHLESFDLVVILLNTPGGLVTTTKSIITLIGDSPVPTAIWIAPEGASATSAGAIIACSAHVLLMADGTNIGAATPVDLGADIVDKDLKSKAVNDLEALVQSLAEARGRNKKLYATMVSEAASFTAQHALKSNLIDAIAHNRQELLRALDQRTITVRGESVLLTSDENAAFTALDMDLGQQVLNIFANPTTAYILFLLGAALLYFELQAPGTFIGGAIGALCLLLAGIGFQVVPINFGALGLIVLALVLFVLEAYITSFGLLAIAGLIALVAGSLFLFRTDQAYIDFSVELVIASGIAVALFMLGISFFIWRERRREKHPKNYYSLVGKPASIIAILPPDRPASFRYQVRVDGEIWQARSTVAHAVGSTCVVSADDDGTMHLTV